MQCRQEAQSGTQALAHISGSSSVTLTSSMKRTSWELVFIYLCAQAICFSLWVLFRVVQAMSPFKSPALGASRQRSSPNMFNYGSTCATEVFSHLSMYFFFLCQAGIHYFLIPLSCLDLAIGFSTYDFNVLIS